MAKRVVEQLSHGFFPASHPAVPRPHDAEDRRRARPGHRDVHHPCARPFRKRREAERMEMLMEEGFCFEALVVRDHVRRKPTPGRMIKTFERAHSKEARQVRFDESGAFLLSCGMDKGIRVWDVHTLKCVAELYAHLSGVSSLDTRGSVDPPHDPLAVSRQLSVSAAARKRDAETRELQQRQ